MGQGCAGPPLRSVRCDVATREHGPGHAARRNGGQPRRSERPATHTTTVTDAERAALAARDITVIDGTVKRLVIADDRLQAVQLAGGRTVARQAIFIRPALRANLDNPAVLLGC